MLSQVDDSNLEPERTDASPLPFGYSLMTVVGPSSPFGRDANGTSTDPSKQTGYEDGD